MSTLREKMGIRNKQSGLASVEAVLLMPLILMLMYIMVQSAQTMVMFEKRTIESRNAAYTVELYSGGEVRTLDEIRQTADEAVQGVENGLVQAIEQVNSYAEYLALIGIDAGQVGDYVQSDYLTILQKFPIQRYATVSDESDWFYDSMIELSRNKMDDFSAKDDPNIMTDKIKNLFQVLDNEHSKSGVTVGVSVSAYTGPLGLFTPFNGHFFMRDHHAADFATTLNLDDITINDQEVITGGYNLKAGYSEEMETMLKPEMIFNNLFADASTQPIELPGVWDLPLPEPVDPTTGIIPGDPPHFTDPQVQAGYDLYERSGGTLSEDDWYRRVWTGTEDPGATGGFIPVDGNGGDLGDNLDFTGESRLRYPPGHVPADLVGRIIPRQQAHHIVPWSHSRTIGTARRLEQWGIDIDSPENGVWLPHSDRPPAADNPHGRTPHNNTFTHAYLDYVNSLFAGVRSPAEARAALASLKRDLINGREVWN